MPAVKGGGLFFQGKVFVLHWDRLSCRQPPICVVRGLGLRFRVPSHLCRGCSLSRPEKKNPSPPHQQKKKGGSSRKDKRFFNTAFHPAGQLW